ncbi:hypothetical protein A6A40_17280 (plasmid) [Azospirillum humicireducens]|uniref:Uncharacterized protein n=1 Tax=Azospirillum humicireducens TaxID=1226968 RepID=A0A2R4VQV6_9PROT|nr:hypothetical protein [Azospirillum humicireducens]AWB06805.1 hypothetical protein A6A40_17280 [Azospirillum humicireducens]
MTEQKKNITVIPMYAVHLEDLVRPVAVVSVSCVACGHTTDVDPLDMIAKHGKHAWLKEVQHKLRCGKCKELGLVTVRLTWQG